MRAAAYARFSTDRQQHNSIEYQLAEIYRYCAEHGITIVATFTDEGETGTNTARSGFQSMLEAATRGDFDAVVIYDILRGSRDVGDWFTFRKQMLHRGITVLSTADKLGDMTDGNDFLVELLTVGMGQREVLETRKKSIAGVAIKAQKGVFLGGTPPLGYTIEDGKYVIDPGEARTVRTIFELYGEGKSYDDILRAVDGAIGKFGRPLGKNSLHSILTNERYIGVYTWNKRKVKLFRKWAGGAPNPNCVRIEGIIPEIIDKATWERVQKRMSDNKRNASNKAKRSYLLSGLIECEECGATYVGHTSTNKKGVETRYYVCGNKYRTHTCQAKNINAAEIEGFVIDGLKRYFLELDFEAEANRIALMVNNSTPDLKAERAELASIEAKLNNGLRAILNGFDNFPELQDEMDKLRVRKGELEDIIARRSASTREVDPADIVRIFEYALDHWDDDFNTILREHITKIYAHADGSYSVNVGVHISGCGGPICLICATIPRSA